MWWGLAVLYITLVRLNRFASGNYHRIIHVGDAGATTLCPLEVKFTTNLTNHVPIQYLRGVRLAAVLQYLQAPSVQAGADGDEVDWVVIDDSADSVDSAAEYGRDTDPIAWTFTADSQDKGGAFTIQGGAQGISEASFRGLLNGLNVTVIPRTEAPCAMCDSMDTTQIFTNQCSSSEEACGAANNNCPKCQSTSDQINTAGVGVITGAAVVALTPLVQAAVTQGAAQATATADGLATATAPGCDAPDINDPMKENLDVVEENLEALQGDEQSQFILLCY